MNIRTLCKAMDVQSISKIIIYSICIGRRTVSFQKLNNPLLFFPNGYTTNALRNNPTVMPMATWIMEYPTLKTIVLRSVLEVTGTRFILVGGPERMRELGTHRASSVHSSSAIGVGSRVCNLIRRTQSR